MSGVTGSSTEIQSQKHGKVNGFTFPDIICIYKMWLTAY